MSKRVFVYNIERRSVERHTLNINENIPHECCYIQMPNEQVFIIGGRHKLHVFEIPDSSYSNFELNMTTLSLEAK